MASRSIARSATRSRGEWRRHTDRPLTIVMGDLAEAVTFYSPDHPDSVPDFDLRVAPWVTPERLEREGYAVLCDQPACVNEAARRAAAEPRAIRREFELSRRYLGQAGSERALHRRHCAARCPARRGRSPGMSDRRRLDHLLGSAAFDLRQRAAFRRALSRHRAGHRRASCRGRTRACSTMAAARRSMPISSRRQRRSSCCANRRLACARN